MSARICLGRVHGGKEGEFEAVCLSVLISMLDFCDDRFQTLFEEHHKWAFEKIIRPTQFSE